MPMVLSGSGPFVSREARSPLKRRPVVRSKSPNSKREQMRSMAHRLVGQMNGGAQLRG